MACNEDLSFVYSWNQQRCFWLVVQVKTRARLQLSVSCGSREKEGKKGGKFNPGITSISELITHEMWLELNLNR